MCIIIRSHASGPPTSTTIQDPSEHYEFQSRENSLLLQHLPRANKRVSKVWFEESRHDLDIFPPLRRRQGFDNLRLVYAMASALDVGSGRHKQFRSSSILLHDLELWLNNVARDMGCGDDALSDGCSTSITNHTCACVIPRSKVQYVPLSLLARRSVNTSKD